MRGLGPCLNYGDPYLEELSIFFRLLERLIREESWTAEVDLSDVVLVGVTHTKKPAVDIALTGDGQLSDISSAGSGSRKEPKYVALQVVIDRMNDLFGADAFADSQIRGFVEVLLGRLLDRQDLVDQTKVNSRKQFLESEDFREAVTEAVADNQESHNTMADYFFTDGAGINGIIVALADAFYETAAAERAGT